MGSWEEAVGFEAPEVLLKKSIRAESWKGEQNYATHV